MSDLEKLGKWCKENENLVFTLVTLFILMMIPVGLFLLCVPAVFLWTGFTWLTAFKVSYIGGTILVGIVAIMFFVYWVDNH